MVCFYNLIALFLSSAKNLFQVHEAEKVLLQVYVGDKILLQVHVGDKVGRKCPAEGEDGRHHHLGKNQ